MTQLGLPKYPEWAAAAEALAEIGAPAVEPLIRAIRSDNHLLRSRTMDVLGKIGDGRAKAPLRAASKISKEDFRQMAKISGGGMIVEMGAMRAEIPLVELWNEYRKNARAALKAIRR